MFHFNKKHLEDETIPMWVLKFKGDTFYVNHVDCSVTWSTKETPDNSHTKGAIKVKHCHISIDDDNCAVIRPLTEEDKKRLNGKKQFTRVITSFGAKLKRAVSEIGTEVGPIKTAGGGCGTLWFITELYDYDQFYQLKFAMVGTDFRALAENEDYYKAYGASPMSEDEHIDDDDYESLYEN